MSTHRLSKWTGMCSRSRGMLRMRSQCYSGAPGCGAPCHTGQLRSSRFTQSFAPASPDVNLVDSL